jgi:hypothetical protein
LLFDSPPGAGAAGDVGRAPAPPVAGVEGEVGRDVLVDAPGDVVVPLFAIEGGGAAGFGALVVVVLGAVVAVVFGALVLDVAGRFAAELLELGAERAGVVVAASANSLSKSEKPMAVFPGGTIADRTSVRLCDSVRTARVTAGSTLPARLFGPEPAFRVFQRRFRT